MSTKPTLGDGVEFELGMLVYAGEHLGFRPLQTAAEGWYLKTEKVGRVIHHLFARDDKFLWWGVSMFYSTREAAVTASITYRRQLQATLEDEIADLYLFRDDEKFVPDIRDWEYPDD